MYSTRYGKPERRRLGRWRRAWHRAFWLAELAAIVLVWYYAVTLMLAEGLL
ncbi:hypothetical protein [Massilia sp. S19_KUP03_FR1]|uniref:hypothetical protein n=1 Tax=Massilia sp. S19_KUP03_FR1 TaxID=3025503 RepID=UPI002FCDB091